MTNETQTDRLAEVVAMLVKLRTTRLLSQRNQLALQDEAANLLQSLSTDLANAEAQTADTKAALFATAEANAENLKRALAAEARVKELEAENSWLHGVMRWVYANGVEPEGRPDFIFSAFDAAYDSGRKHYDWAPAPRAALNTGRESA